jgi:PST family polysaccharide transporter
MLVPDDYAIVAIAGAVLALVNAISGLGFATSLVREPELSAAKSSTVFWLLAGVSVVVYLTILAFSRSIASFYGAPMLTRVLPILGLSTSLTLLASMPDSLLIREMKYRQRNVVAILSAVVSAVLAVSMATLGLGYWALVVPPAAAAAVSAAGAFALAGFRPAWRFSLAELSAVFKCGISMAGCTLLNYISDNSDYLIMGRVWPKEVFGNYYFAYTRSRQPFEILAGQIGGAVLPAFSRLDNDMERIRAAYIRGTSYLGLISFPGYVLLIGLADLIVPLVFGGQWLPAVPLFRVFAVICFARTFSTLASAPLLALNQIHHAFFFTAFRVLATLPCLLLLASYRAPPLTVSIVLAIIWIVQLPAFLWILYRKVRLSPAIWLQSFGRLMIATIVMAGVCFTMRQACPIAKAGPLLTGMATVTSAILAFALVAWPLAAEFRQFLQRGFRAPCS